MQENLCAIHIDPECRYPASPPFHPHRHHPEYEFGGAISSTPNPAYEAVRNTLRLLGLDAARADTPAWNPLGEIIRPGDAVVIKPNFVLHFNEKGHDLAAVITHGSVIRPVLDYVLKALQGRGSVVVGDAPQGNADFNAIVAFTGIGAVVDFLGGCGHHVALADFRKYRYAPGKNGFLQETRTELAGDPRGYTAIDLEQESELADAGALERLYGADFDRRVIREHHHAGRHEYLIANSVLHADVVISMPKLKLHSKAGVTINLKNLVGINGDKNWLPHYRIGHPGQGGDEYPHCRWGVEAALRSFDRQCQDLLLAQRTLPRRVAYGALSIPCNRLLTLLTHFTGNNACRGDWHGNDTVWRMVLDLNRTLLYADKTGVLRDTPQRRFLSVVDGIVGGEGEGPLGPTPRPAGVVLGGFSLLLVDLVGARLMGIDPAAVPLLHNAMRNVKYPLARYRLEEVVIRSNAAAYQRLNTDPEPNLRFTLPAGWKHRPGVTVPQHA